MSSPSLHTCLSLQHSVLNQGSAVTTTYHSKSTLLKCVWNFCLRWRLSWYYRRRCVRTCRRRHSNWVSHLSLWVLSLPLFYALCITWSLWQLSARILTSFHLIRTLLFCIIFNVSLATLNAFSHKVSTCHIEVPFVELLKNVIPLSDGEHFLYISFPM